MTSGGNTITIETDYDVFSASDVGTVIRILGSEITTDDIEQHDGTITSYTSPTQVTVSFTATYNIRFADVMWGWTAGTDCTAAIQACLNNSSRVQLSAGVYVRAPTSSLTYSPRCQALEGVGAPNGTTLLQADSTTIGAPSINFIDSNYFRLANLRVYGPGINGSYGGHVVFDLLDGSNTERVAFENVEIKGAAAGTALYCNTPIVSSFKNVKVLLNAATGCRLVTPVSVNIDNCYFITNLINGLQIEDGAGVVVSASAAESNGINYLIENSSNIKLVGCDSEATVHRAPNAPASALTLSAVSGTIPAGTYKIKYTFARQYDDLSLSLESLPSPEASITLSSPGGIQFTLPAAPTDAPLITRALIYMTPTNGGSGSELYFDFWNLMNVPRTVAETAYGTFGGPPPTISAIGHSVVVTGSQHVSIDCLSSNGLAATAGSAVRSIWITGGSNDVSVEQTRLLPGSGTPTYDVQIDSGCKNVFLRYLTRDNSDTAAVVQNNGTNTLIWTVA